MSYRTIKDYIVRRMNSLGYSESQSKFDFSQEADTNFDKAFIVTSPAGEIVEGNTLATTFYPTRVFSVKVAWQVSENAIFEYDLINQEIDAIIKDLHYPTNYIGDSIKNFQYKSHTLKEESNYLVAEIIFDGTDSVTF